MCKYVLTYIFTYITHGYKLSTPPNHRRHQICTYTDKHTCTHRPMRKQAHVRILLTCTLNSIALGGPNFPGCELKSVPVKLASTNFANSHEIKGPQSFL